MCVLLEVWSFDFSTNGVRACVCVCVHVCVGVCGCDVSGQRYQLWFMFYGMEHTHRS